MEHYAKQNATGGFFIFADDSTALGTAKTGLTISATLSKNGGTANAVAPTVSEIGGGWYWVAPIAAHRDTIGRALWQFTATGATIAGRVERIGLVDPELAEWGVWAAVVRTLTDKTGFELTSAERLAIAAALVADPTFAQLVADAAAAKDNASTAATAASTASTNASTAATNAASASTNAAAAKTSADTAAANASAATTAANTAATNASSAATAAGAAQSAAESASTNAAAAKTSADTAAANASTAATNASTAATNAASASTNAAAAVAAADSAASSASSAASAATSANTTAGQVLDSLAAAKGAGFLEATDSLEAIRNRGDAAWTGGGGAGADVDEAAIALDVFRRLAGRSVAALDAPAEGEPLDVIHSADFALSIDASTALASKLVWCVRRCRDDSNAALEADSETGLLSVLGETAADATRASVTRTSSTQVDVWVAASIMDDLRLGQHFGELREIAADGTVASRFETDLVIRRSAGRRVA